MKFSVNVDAIYQGKDFYQAVEELAKAGIKNIEFWGWWDKDIDRLLELKERYGVEYTGFCAKWICMVDPRLQKEYLEEFEKAVQFAKKIGCKNIFTKPEDKTDAPFAEQYAIMMDTLKQAVAMAKAEDITVLFEPVSYLEAPNTFLGTSDLGFQIIDEIGDSHLKLLYDLYHMQLDEGDIVRRVVTHLDRIGHLHAAGIADRHELWDGEIDYGYVFAKIDEAGYDGLTGLEYFPTKEPLAELKKVVLDHIFR